jgi:hypothetical protein
MDEQWQIIVPMTSITDETGDAGSQPWVYYLTVINEQALIALRHLLAIWDMEGDPADLGVWSRPGVDAGSVWSHLQGAMFAGIALTRMLDPRVRAISAKASQAEQERHAARRDAAAARGERLRALLDVPADSPLLGIRRVRDALEHFDERIDEVVLAGEVASVSDFHIATGGEYAEITAAEVVAETGRAGARHVTMRQFAPDLGVLRFGGQIVDLFAYETALHNLLAELPRAYEEAAGPASGTAGYGLGRVTRWSTPSVAERRAAIRKVRDEVREGGVWLLRPSMRPRTVVAIWGPQEDGRNAPPKPS